MSDFEPNGELEDFIDGLSVEELVAFSAGLSCGAASLSAVADMITKRAQAKLLVDMALKGGGAGDA